MGTAGLAALAAVLVTMAGCGSASATSNNPVVQVWSAATSGQQAEFLATGVVVGDGRHVLTVLDYESYSPGDIEVVAAGGRRFDASIQGIDTGTSATLLKLKSGRLSPALAGDPAAFKQGDQVFISRWSGKPLTYEHLPGQFGRYQQVTAPLGFDVAPTESQGQSEWDGFGDWLGAVVTDSSGKVLGLAGNVYNGLLSTLAVPTPSVVSITPALQLLSTGASQTGTNGPVLATMFGDEGPGSYFFAGEQPDYGQMSADLETLFGQLGQPVPAQESPHFAVLGLSPYSTDGKVLVVVYPQPVQLRGQDGTVLATAKWVAVQWGTAEGTRLFYGSQTYKVDGGFEISGYPMDLNGSVQILESHRTLP